MHALRAQVVLIDSFEMDDNTMAIVTPRLCSNGANFQLLRGWMNLDTNALYTKKIIYKDKYTITLPDDTNYRALLYIDDSHAYFFEFIRGDTALDEGTKYIDGHNILSKYSILKNGHLLLVDSVGISRESQSLIYKGCLPSSPILITIPTAVEGGGCNSEYSIYDSNLKLKKMLKPNLPICGSNSKMFFENNRVHLTDQDAHDKSLISWCISDLNFDNIKDIQIKVAENFHVFNMGVSDNLLYLMGWEKAEGTPIHNYTLVYDFSGNLIEKISFSNVVIGYVYKQGKNLIGFPLGGSSILMWSGEKKTTEPIFPLKFGSVLIDKKIVEYRLETNKIYIYENE